MHLRGSVQSSPTGQTASQPCIESLSLSPYLGLPAPLCTRREEFSAGVLQQHVDRLGDDSGQHATRFSALLGYDLEEPTHALRPKSPAESSQPSRPRRDFSTEVASSAHLVASARSSPQSHRGSLVCSLAPYSPAVESLLRVIDSRLAFPRAPGFSCRLQWIKTAPRLSIPCASQNRHLIQHNSLYYLFIYPPGA